MGKQKLTTEKVELIKHLLNEKQHTHQGISEIFYISRQAITKINNNQRWSEVDKPDYNRGEYLYYKLLNNELK